MKDGQYPLKIETLSVHCLLIAYQGLERVVLDEVKKLKVVRVEKVVLVH